MTTTRHKARAAIASTKDSRAWGHVVGAGTFVIVALFIPPWPESFTMPKVVALTALAFALIPLLWLRRSILLAGRIPLVLLAAFVALALLSQFFSGAPQAISLWGDWFRRSGTLTVISLGLLLLGTSLLSRAEIRVALSWIVLSGVPATVYGLVQLVGADPFPWNNQGWIVSTFGNPNFAAAGLSMLALLTAGMALFGDFITLWRVLMAPLAALEALLALQTGSSQAIFAMGVGIVAGAVAWLLAWDNSRRVKALASVAIVAAVGTALTVMALLGLGPLVSVISSDTLMFRQWYWGAAVDMAATHPLLGVGPDGYGRFFGEFRSEQAAQMYSGGSSAAHDVPLQWAATLGIPAALVYVALMASVLIIAGRRLWQQGPAVSRLAVPILAVWGAYQIQSLVSIDAIPVATLGWLSSGLLLAVTSAREQSPTTSPGAWIGAGALAVVGFLAWLPALLASNASGTVVQGTTEDDVYQAISLVEGTTLPCEPSVRVAQWMIQVAPAEQTINGVIAGAEADDRCYGLVNAAADFTLKLEQPERALAFAQRGIEIDPLSYSQWVMLAKAQHALGDDQGAVSSLRRALEVSPSAQVEVDELAAEWDLSLA